MNYYDYRNAVSSIVWMNAQRQSIEQILCTPSGTIPDTAQSILPHERLPHIVIHIPKMLLKRITSLLM